MPLMNKHLKASLECGLAHGTGFFCASLITMVPDPKTSAWEWCLVVPISLISLLFYPCYAVNTAVVIVQGNSVAPIEVFVTIGIPFLELCSIALCLLRRFRFLLLVIFFLAAGYAYYLGTHFIAFIQV